ncbi:MAG: CHAT domain-containing protein [Cyanobacteria bacterium P01_D01_bin.36]
MKSTVLIVSSNPQNTSFLRLDRELRIIREAIQKSTLRSQIDIQVEWAVRTTDLLYALQRHKPWVIHFCGHGEGPAGLTVEDEVGQKTTISNAALTEIASQFATDTECILLNACYSKVQASLMSQHINYVVGMSSAIEDKAALAFTRGFYTALGGGESIANAYRFGKSQIAIECSNPTASPLNERKATTVDGPVLQSANTAPVAANLMPLLFQKEIPTEFDHTWMSLTHQTKAEETLKDKEPVESSVQQPVQQQNNSVSGITFGSGNATFNFSPTQVHTSHINLSTSSSPASPAQPAVGKQSFQAAIVQLQQRVANDGDMNLLLKQGAIAQIEQILSDLQDADLQDAEVDSANLQKTLATLAQGFANSPPIAADIEKATRLFHSVWGG